MENIKNKIKNLQVSLTSAEYCIDRVTNFTKFGVQLKTPASEGTAIPMKRKDTIYKRSCLLVPFHFKILTPVLDKIREYRRNWLQRTKRECPVIDYGEN